MNEDRYILYLQGRGFSDAEYRRLPIITQIIRKNEVFLLLNKNKRRKKYQGIC